MGGVRRVPAPAAGPSAEPFCIVIPPPNVTGRLHIGHALNNTLQDILARFERMRGKDVLWQPGTDHAGIATQLDRRAPAGRAADEPHRAGPREIPGRSLEVERRIRRRHRRSSCAGWAPPPTGRANASPWTRGCRAPSSKCSSSFIAQGLIYKDKRLVNWDPRLQTAVSRSRSREYRDQGPSLAHQISHRGQPGQFITVATTRPETMLGDTAVAVHPDDARYKDAGRQAWRVLPLTEPADPHHRR